MNPTLVPMVGDAGGFFKLLALAPGVDKHDNWRRNKRACIITGKRVNPVGFGVFFFSHG